MTARCMESVTKSPIHSRLAFVTPPGFVQADAAARAGKAVGKTKKKEKPCACGNLLRNGYREWDKGNLIQHPRGRKSVILISWQA